MLAEWNAKRINQYEQEFITLNVGLSKKYYNKTGDNYLKRINKFLSEKGIDVVLDHDDTEVIGQMFEVLQLIHLGILENKYPFAINNETKFFKEVAFFQIDEDDVMFEIGAGSGMFGLMMKLMHPTVSLYLNELSYSNFELIQELMDAHAKKISTENLFCVKGKKKSTELETLKADKIIIRHTLHHFKKMDEMLNSIKLSMDADSNLYINESTTDLHAYEGDCQYKMSKKQIVDLMEESGFVLVEMLDLGDNLLFNYKLKS